jgi:hypothetical protein
MPRRVKKFVCVGVAALAAAAVACHADIDPLSGIDFVTIGDGDNPNYLGAGLNTGHGQVNYEYRMGRTEVPLSLWVEFMNACFDRPVNDRIPHVYTPTQWSPGFATPNTPGGIRWSVPAGREMFPVGGVDWRTCAILTNWLHNNKSLDRSAFLTGAYEVGTFGYFGETDGFTDQITRSPGARYWIPSLDEWMKSAHWDPTKVNTDGTTGGYWLYSNSSDTPFVYGPPGVLVRFSNPFPTPTGSSPHPMLCGQARTSPRSTRSRYRWVPIQTRKARGASWMFRAAWGSGRSTRSSWTATFFPEAELRMGLGGQEAV